MKKQRAPITLITAILLVVILITGFSCTKNEIFSEDVSGILSCRFQLPDGRVFDCEIDQVKQMISNSKDSLLFGTSSASISKITPVFTTTIGARVYYNGSEIKSGESVIDLSKPVKLEAKYNSSVRAYDVKALTESKDYSETSGAKINTDMRVTGLPAFNSYSAAWFKNTLYILGAYYPNATSATGTAYYELYSSSDGAKWTKVETNPKVVGGYGAQLVVLGDKMFAAGGARLWGKDVNGTSPEASVSWKMMSTANGKDWTDCTQGQVNAPSGRAFPQVIVHNNKIVLRRGKMYGFGMWQNVNHSDTYQTTDGTAWTRVAANPSTATNRNDDAMFSFSGRLWIAGGYVNWISDANQREDIWSSGDNGITWQQESSAVGTEMKRFGHTVVSNGSKLFMIGGERVSGSTRTGTGLLMESLDGRNWTPVPSQLQLPVAFSTRILPNVVLGEENLAWIIGGYEKSVGNYTIGGLTMISKYDVWTKRVK